MWLHLYLCIGGDSGCDNRSDLCHGFAESAVSLSQSILGGVYPLLHHPPTPERQRWGHRISHQLRLMYSIVTVIVNSFMGCSRVYVCYTYMYVVVCHYVIQAIINLKLIGHHCIRSLVPRPSLLPLRRPGDEARLRNTHAIMLLTAYLQCV